MTTSDQTATATGGSNSRSSNDDGRVVAISIHIEVAKSVMHAPEVISCVFIAFVAIALFQLMRNGKELQANPSNA